MIRLLGSLSGLGGGGGGGSSAPDLTAPSAPAAVNLASSATSLGSTALGSWSAAVTVTATAQGSDGSTPTVTVSGSGAGPYSVSIASGLSAGVSYIVRAVGTGGDGQVAGVSLLVRVAPAAASAGWVTLAEYDLTTVDTASATTATGGDIALTVGGAAFLTLKTVTGSSTGSVTPTNGVGVEFSTTNTRGAHIEIDWTALGVDPSIDPCGFAWEWAFTSMNDGGAVVPMLHTTGSGFASNHSFGPRWNRSSSTYARNARFFNSAANISSNFATGAFSGNYSGAAIITPGGGGTVWSHDGDLVAIPSMDYGPRRFSLSQGWVATALTFPAGPPKAAFGVDNSVCAWRKLRVLKWGV